MTLFLPSLLAYSYSYASVLVVLICYATVGCHSNNRFAHAFTTQIPTTARRTRATTFCTAPASIMKSTFTTSKATPYHATFLPRAMMKDDEYINWTMNEKESRLEGIYHEEDGTSLFDTHDYDDKDGSVDSMDQLWNLADAQNNMIWASI